MPENKTPPAERITASFKQLAVSSHDLTSAADDLGRAISTLDAALKTLNLGVSAWHQIARNEEPHGSYWTRDIGYTKVSGKWGIALRKTSGYYPTAEHHEEVWLFSDAPRWMCIESVGKIPELFEELIKRTEETTKKIRAKTTEAGDLAAAISAAASEVAPKRN